MAYYIQNIDTGLVLDVLSWSNSGQYSTVIMYGYHGGKNQLWVSKEGRIHSLENDLVLDINPTDWKSVIINKVNGAPWQKWYFDADNTIRSEFRNLVLDVENGNRNPAAKVIAYQKHNNANQLFKRVYV